MKRQFLLLALVLLVLPLTGVVAQSTENSGFNILSFDIGYAPYFRLDPDAANTYDRIYGGASVFGLNVRVAEPLSVGAVLISTDVGDSVTGIKLKYEVASTIKFAATLGSFIPQTGSAASAELATGLGVEYMPFGRTAQSGVYSDFKIGLDYLIPPASGFDKGILLFAITVGLGI